MGKLLAEATIRGIDFTFERHRCGEWCRHVGAAIGMTAHEKAFGTRIGICLKFTGFETGVWASSPSGQEHIQRISRYLQQEADDQLLRDEANPRQGDSIHREYRSQDDSYSIRIRGLTREQALNAYRGAILNL